MRGARRGSGAWARASVRGLSRRGRRRSGTLVHGTRLQTVARRNASGWWTRQPERAGVQHRHAMLGIGGMHLRRRIAAARHTRQPVLSAVGAYVCIRTKQQVLSGRGRHPSTSSPGCRAAATPEPSPRRHFRGARRSRVVRALRLSRTPACTLTRYLLAVTGCYTGCYTCPP